jgi:sec-independent protein translocase protein TatA
MFEGLFRPGHLLIILIIVMFFFGPSKLPQLGGALGKTIRDFKKAVNESNDTPATPATPAATTPPKAIEAKAEGGSATPTSGTGGAA